MLYQITPDLWIDYDDLRTVYFHEEEDEEDEDRKVRPVVNFNFKSEVDSQSYNFDLPEVIQGFRDLLAKMNMLQAGSLNLQAKQLYLNETKADELIEHVQKLESEKEQKTDDVHVPENCHANHIHNADLMCEAS